MEIPVVNPGDVVVLRHRTRFVEIHKGILERKGFLGRFVCFPSGRSVKLEMMGGWFPLDPEILKCELTFDLAEYEIECVNSPLPPLHPEESPL